MTSVPIRLLKNKSFKILLFIITTVLPGYTASSPSTILESEIPSVLILHSYHPGFIWTESISVGLRSILEKADFEIDVHIEYMDTKVYLPEIMFPQLEQLYVTKYKDKHFDLIITTDDNALNFLLPRRDLLFREVPIVFCGLNNYTEARIEGVQGITGVAEAMDLTGTIELALDLRPETRYVAVVNDNTPTGIWNLQSFRSASPVFADRIEFIELFNLTTEELIESLHALPDETAVILLSFYRDRAGRTFSYQEYTLLVTANSNAPVYTAWDMFVGYGVIGGIVISGEAQGEHAALMALRVLNGESADDIQVLTESPNVPMFDFDVVQRFGISLSDLPAERVVINEPVSLYYRHKTFIWIASAFVLLQSFMILALIINVLRRKRAEQEQLNLERQILHAQKLESLGILAGGIAHDFNNLLTGVLGNADLALFDLPRTSPVRQYIKDIETAAHRAAELCQQMLDYSGRGHSIIEVVDLSELVREMSHILEASIMKKAVLKYNFPENPVTIMVDATQIRQVIMNLITNASDAIGNISGVISISTGIIQYDSSYQFETHACENLPDGKYAFLEVTDTGCGMDNLTKQKLFDPFFSSKVDGRGLGLSAVLGIVRGHKGMLSVDSKPSMGTTFKILLPASDESAKRLKTEDNEHLEWIGQGTVLLADDEKIVRKTGSHMLERLGLNVILAVDGRQAVKIFRERHEEIDYVLLDLTMPNLDGEQAFREMKRIREDVRIILSSGYSRQEVSRRFAGIDLFGFIQKPYVLKELQEAISKVLKDKT